MNIKNAISIIIGGKAVKTLKIGGNAIYESPASVTPPPTTGEGEPVLDPVPSYWLEELNRAKRVVEANRAKMGADNIEFIFMTDIHWGEKNGSIWGTNNGNKKLSPSLVKWVKDNVGDMYVLYGGDTIYDENPTHDRAVAEMQDAMSKFGLMFATMGNHDNNDAGKNYSTNKDWMVRSKVLSNQEVYDLMLAQNLRFPNAHNITELNPNATNVEGDWFDDDAHKVRFIQFNFNQHNSTAMNNRARTNLMLMLDDMVEKHPDYRAVALTHGNAEYILDLTGFSVCQKESIKRLKVVLGGHIHSPKYNEQTIMEHTIPFYVGKGDVPVTTNNLKTDWQSFCIVQLDFTNNKMYVSNIGHGGDYYSNYGEWGKYYNFKMYD